MRAVELRDEQGFTLVELLVGALVGLIVIGVGVKLFTAVVDEPAEAQKTSSALQDGRVLAERIAREIRTGESVEIAEPNHLQLLAYEGSQLRRIDYSCAAGTCTRTETPADGGTPLSTTSATGLASDTVFSYEPSAADPEYVGVALAYSGGRDTPVALADGSTLRNHLRKDPGAGPEPVPSCEPRTTTVTASADAGTASIQPTRNYGTAATINDRTPYIGTLRWGTSTNARYRFYLRFSMPSLPSGCTVTSASLQLRVGTGWGWNRPIRVAPASASWSETGITWNNQPAPANGGSLVSSQAGENCWYTWDVTAAVGQLYGSGATSNGLALLDSDEGNVNPQNTTPAPFQREMGAPAQLEITWG
jgi:type II secretory pathway pseudopilin PulG